MEAIYLITPNEKTVKELMSDFQSQHRTQYRAAHVYFTEGMNYILNGKYLFTGYFTAPPHIPYQAFKLYKQNNYLVLL